MELAGELFLTAFIALFLSFLVAKLVAVVVAGDSEVKSSSVSDEGVVEAEVRYGEGLRVEGCESERRVESVGEVVEKVDRFEERAVREIEEIVEDSQHRQEQASIVEEGLGDESKTVGLPGKELEGEEKVSIDRGFDFDIPVFDEARADDSFGQQSAKHDVVAPESDEAEIDGGGLKGKDEGNVVGLHNVSDEEDWEGIERNELENDFAAAVKFVKSEAEEVDPLANVGSDVQMELYGLHKVAMEGPCREPQPLVLDLDDGAKWNAWQRLGNMSPEKAMEQYITVLSDKVPGWMEDQSAGGSEPESSETEIPSAVASVSSTLLHPQPNITNEREPELRSGAEEGVPSEALNLENR
ncbi:hypothetical protein UlMin_035357, partial [Ulmus minor]